MAFEELTFSFEEVLTSTKMNKIDTNVDEVRKSHKGSSAPAALVAGVQWIYDGASPWVLRIYDGADQIDMGVIEPTNDLYFLQTGSGVYLDDATSAAGPHLKMSRKSDSPSNADKIGVTVWEASDSAGTLVTYAALRGEISDPTAGAEYGRVIAKSKVAGVDTQEFGWGRGVVVGDPTDGFQGPGILNAESDLQVGGVSVLLTGGVTRTDLDTSTGSGAGGGTVALPGGQYGFYPRTASGGLGAGFEVYLNRDAQGLGDYLHNASSWSSRYISASPPFDLGDGDMQGFIFARLRGAELLQVWIADVPPWAYNGPTDITPHVIDRKTGRKFRRVLRTSTLLGSLQRGEISLDAMREMIASPEYQGHDLVEIDQVRKNADMGLLPHPFGTPDPGDKIVLLDPMDELVGTLIELQEQGEDIAQLVMTGKIRPNTTELIRAGPAGVIQVGIRA